MSANWTIDLAQTDRIAWDSAHLAACAAYQQDWAYGDVMVRAGAEVMRVGIVGPSGHVVGRAQFIVRPYAMIARFALCTYGPFFVDDLSESERAAALRALRKAIRLRWPRLVAFTPDDAIVPAGFRRLMTGDATVRIDLGQDETALRAGLDGKWRNRLVAAEKSDLSFTTAGLKAGQYQWLLDAEMKQRKARGYRGLPPAMTIAWQEEKQKAVGADRKAGLAVYRADLKGQRDPAGAMLFLVHGRMATYHIGWSSEEGRKQGAHNLILWNAIKDLQERGVDLLDLGGVNTQSGAGIARFKLGTGGEILQRAGTFC